MPEKIELLEHGGFYHIFNRGINGCSLFKKTTNYDYFIKLYHKHISPIADTYAWVLMGNHFRFLVQIKDKAEGQKQVHQYFSNLFNAYTKAFNKMENRHGNLFERPFHRKRITTDNYLKRVIIYIHQNPVHHGFCANIDDYPWSSYQTCISPIETKLMRGNVLEMFDDIGNFKAIHQIKQDLDELEG